jgi:SAM-dependent methyltransferase
LLRTAERVTGVDSSASRLRICRDRFVDEPRLQLIHANVLDWAPSDVYDGVFLAFWLSHVPRPLLPAFLDTIRSHLRPGGYAFIVDHKEGATTERYVERDVVLRRSAHGLSHLVTKVPYSTLTLYRMLQRNGWKSHILETDSLFLYGLARPGKLQWAPHRSAPERPWSDIGTTQT